MSSIRSALVLMCRRILSPLVRILLRHGIGAGELKALVDSVYAHAGTEYLVQQGEQVTYSKLAVITGVNRAFLPGILKASDQNFLPRSHSQVNRVTRVLDGWHEDPLFLAYRGAPAVLRIDGGSSSFRDLVDLYSGGIYYRTMLAELLRVGAVHPVGNDRIRVVRRNLAQGVDGQHLASFGQIAGDLLATFEHNLGARESERMPVNVVTFPASQSDLALFSSHVGKRADIFMRDLQKFIRANPCKPVANGELQSESIGAAIVTIHRTSSEQRRL